MLFRSAKVKNYKELGLNSETAVVFNLTEKMQVIINTWYGGEMKKGMFSMMNYFLPLKGMASMHCSANTDLNGDINNVPTKKIPYFDFEVPTVLNGVDTGILDPRDTYADASQWEEKAKDLEMCIRDSRRAQSFGISSAITGAACRCKPECRHRRTGSGH